MSDDVELPGVSEPGMADAPPPTATVCLDGSGYAVHLTNFDGPLDLLLHLIRTEELDIFDIEISRLTSAYVETLREMHRQGMEPASEFLLMAATLIHIKSKMLLPRTAADDATTEDDLDPREFLVRQLLEYQAFKAVAAALGEQFQLGRDVFIRPGRQDRPEQDDPELSGLGIYQLAKAFRALMNRQRYQPPHEIYVERITIGERIAQIADRLAKEKRVTFAELCSENHSREEVITTFLALLEMARLKLISVNQRHVGTPLYVEARAEGIAAKGEDAAGTLVEERSGATP